MDEASELAGLDGSSERAARDVHAAVPALIGRTALHLAKGEYEDAIRVGSGGLALAEASGYGIWVLHRLLPMVAEAQIRTRDLDAAQRTNQRLRSEGERMNHSMSLVWATAADALITWTSGREEEAVELLRRAAETTEEMGIVYDAARIRRQYAGRLARMGRVEEAYEELRAVHAVFERLGATPELDATRLMFGEIKKRRPAAQSLPSAVEALTPRQYEIVLLVAEHLSNQEIADRLGIGIRTAEKHLTNIYKRLKISGNPVQQRGRLADMVREQRIQVSG